MEAGSDMKRILKNGIKTFMNRVSKKGIDRQRRHPCQRCSWPFMIRITNPAASPGAIAVLV